MNLEKAQSLLKENADSIEQTALKSFKCPIAPQTIDNFDSLDSELDILSNLCCLSCHNLPTAPISKCSSCDHLYCENCIPEKCVNNKCKRSAFQKVGRNIRNIIYSFNIGEVSYESYVKEHLQEFKS